MTPPDGMSPQDGSVRASSLTVLGRTFRGRCPRCGQGALFRNPVSLAHSCSACGLDFQPYEQGDGPTVFTLMIVGFVVMGGAMVLELRYQAPYWLQAVIWLPATAFLTIASLRLFKAWLVGEQFRHDAAEGRLSDDQWRS